MPATENGTSLKREVVLLLVGAVISSGTASVTNYFNAKGEERRNSIEKKFTINDQLAKDIGLRLYLTNEIYKCRRNKDSTLEFWVNKYKQSKEDWNIKFLSYQSLLNSYYGQNILIEFRDSIYNPLISLGQKAENNKFDSLSGKQLDYLRIKNIDFISSIYTMAQH